VQSFDTYQSFSNQERESEQGQQLLSNQEYVTRSHRKRDNSSGQAVGNLITSTAKDVFVLHKNLFTWNTFRVISTVFPLFIGARMIDEKLQRCFYDLRARKNINQMPSWCHTVAKTSIAVPLVLLGSDLFFSKSNEKRWTAQIMLIGMPFVIWTKKLVKQMKFDACLRPWHEKLSSGKERSFGGFPSGHMAQALYMAVLYGSRYGPRYAIPLSGIAAFIGVTFLTCNRHYMSQLIAGGAFGTIYALAASKLVEKKLTDHVKLGIAVDEVGHPTFSASVKW
jgi:membrane-associated phospholipid phosphatase